MKYIMKYIPETKEDLKKLCDDLSINLGDIDTSKITDMSELFRNTKREDFSGIENWDVSSVTDMRDMFYHAKSFNQPLDMWDVSHVANMSGMFEGAKSFNKPLNSWDISNVTNMGWMFEGCKNLHPSLKNWDVSHVRFKDNMFKDVVFAAADEKAPKDCRIQTKDCEALISAVVGTLQKAGVEMKTIEKAMKKALEAARIQSEDQERTP